MRSTCEEPVKDTSLLYQLQVMHAWTALMNWWKINEQMTNNRCNKLRWSERRIFREGQRRVINSMDRCLNSRSDTLGNDRKKCNRYGSCSSAGDDHGPYAMVKSLPQQLQCMHASTVLISLLLHEGDQKTVIVETMRSMGLADDKSWQIWTKSLQSYELGKIHAWVRHRPIVCSAMIATDFKRRSAAVSWSQQWTAANWYDLKGWSCDLKQDTGDLEQYQYWRSCDRSNNGRTLKVCDRSKN